MNKIVKSMLISFSLFLLSIHSLQANVDEFPGRKAFPDIPVIELAQLRDKINDVVIVDARSRYEYETLRIKNAINLPVTSKTFEQDLKNLVDKVNKPIVFYCNGRTCFKSYIAVKKGLKAGIKNLIAYDAGVFEWSRNHPGLAVLLGKNPIDPRKLISKNSLKTRFLNPETFSNKIVDHGKGSIVLDIRDKYQRAGVGFYPGKERWASLDNLKELKKHLKLARQTNKTLFIYDEVGKQVRWLQYALKEEGIKDYYFMEKGAAGYSAMLKSME